MDVEDNNSDQTLAQNIPEHVAIIMDGNGRWAQKRGLPRTIGHKNGVEAVRNIVKAAGELGVKYLTLYSFSTENWNRPKSEVTELFALLKMFISRDLAELHENNVRIKIIGTRDKVPQDVQALIDEAQHLTRDNTAQTLVVAFNYGSRQEISDTMQAIAQKAVSGEISPEDITPDFISNSLQTYDIPDPDLLIRTSGEIRLSNFLLWQLAYSELIFIDCLWPDFSREDLELAIGEYAGRVRKFGGLASANSQ